MPGKKKARPQGATLRLTQVAGTSAPEVAATMCRVASRVGIVVECEWQHPESGFQQMLVAYTTDVPSNVLLRVN